MDTDDSVGVGVLSDLSPEGGQVGGELEGEVFLGEDLVLEQVGHGDLGGGVEPQVVPLQPVHVVLEVGVLSGSGDGCGVDDHGGEHLGVTLLLVHVEEEGDERPLEPGSVAL